VPVDFLAIRAEDAPTGHRVMLIDRGGRVVYSTTHLPWFVSDTPVRKDAVDVERADGSFLRFLRSGFVYVPGGDAYKIYVRHKSLVPSAARTVLSMNGRAGLYNIKYLVRAAYDIQSEKGARMLGYRTPLAFLPNKEMLRDMESAIEDIGELKVMALDIEVYSRSGGFPRRGDPILSITYSVFKLRDNIFTRDWPEEGIHYVLNDSGDVDGSKRVVKEFISIVRRERPDIIVGYNSSGFDFPYMQPFLPGSVQLVFDFYEDVYTDSYIPHIDLMVLRDSMGSSLGLRRQSVYALDDVALEALSGNKVDKFYDMGWLYSSRYIEAERKLNHAKLKEYFDRGDRLYFDYIVADVLLTSYLARIWLYPLILLALLTGIPPNVIQGINTGQMAEYVLAELLRRLGLYPQLKEREAVYGRLTPDTLRSQALRRGVEEAAKHVRDMWVFSRGKVYVRSPGMFGGPGYRIVELDFAQLYPTDMVRYTVDPTSMFVLERVTVSNDGAVSVTRGADVPAPLLVENAVWAALRDSSGLHFFKVAPGYGPVSWFIYKLYSARNETKKLKKLAEKERRVELIAPDQAVKIYNNSNYGAFSKSRGNLVNELSSAAVFWRTQKLLYEVIEAIEGDVSETLGAELKVLYGDTDSAYVLAPENVDPEELERAVNAWIQRRYGDLYRMELEDTYRYMVIPRRKDSDEPSAKSYITLDANMRIAKIKGEFFKIEAPLGIRDRLIEFYEELLRRRVSSVSELESLVVEFLRGQPGYKYFIKKSVSSFVSEDGLRLKRVNRPFHYAALVTLCESGSPGTEVLLERVAGIDKRTRMVRCRVDPRVVEDVQRTVIVHYLPSPSGKSTRFAMFVDEQEGEVIVNEVNVSRLVVEREESTNKESVLDRAYVVEYLVRTLRVPRDVLHVYMLRAIRRVFTETLYKKLVTVIAGDGVAPGT